jgi:5'-3' exonuclease
VTAIFTVGDTFYLDAPSLTYRAYFALPTSVKAPDGRPVNAVRGVMEMAKTLLTDRRPDRIVAVFDADYRPAFRVEAYPPFKAHRPDDPEDLPPQFDILKEVLDAVGIERVEAPGLEADDALATLVRDVPDGSRAVVVTGDRDLLALVRDPDVAVLFTVKGVSQLREFDEAEVEYTYGVPPRLYGQFATLRGDPSDGLPGVPGIGPQRAATLLTKYGSIDGILAHVHELSPKQRESFEASRDYLKAMEIVVPLVRDARLERTTPGEADDNELDALAERYGLGSSSKRLIQALRGER